MGTGKGVNVSGINASGVDAGNYTFNTSASTTANITPASVSANARMHVYDGTTNVAAGSFTLSGLVNGETLNFTGVGTVADKNVGSNKAVSLGSLALGDGTGSSASGLASNYTLTGGTQTASFTPATLVVTGLTASAKVYDANTTATLGGTAVIAALGTDVVTLGGTASGTFADKNVGTGKAVTASGNTLTGTDAGNYNLVQQAGLTADITPASVSANARMHVYDGTTNVAAGSFTLSGLVNGETLNFTGVGTVADKNVGSNKAVSLSSLALGNGTGSSANGLASNYTFTNGSQTASFTPATLVVTGLTASAKVYDANTTATLSGTAVIAALGGDVVTLGGTASGTFADKDVGTGKAVTVSGNTLTGTDAGNYTLVQQAGLMANIAALPVVPVVPPVVVQVVPEVVRNVTNQLVSTVLAPTMGVQPGALSLSPSITVVKNSGLVAAGETSSSKADNGPVVNVAMNIGTMGPTLQIINGGVKLPGNMVNAIE